MLYKIRQETSVFQDNPELLAIPEFAKLDSSGLPTLKEGDLGDRRMRFTMLVADRRSPLRTLPEKQRREKAAQVVGFPMEGKRLDRNGRDAVNGNVPAIEAAITKYREYQYDEHQEDYDALVKQIQEIRDYLKSDKDDSKDKGKALEQAAKLGERLPNLIEAKQKLETLLQISTDQAPEITTFTSADVPDEYFQGGTDSLPAIEVYHSTKQRQSE